MPISDCHITLDAHAQELEKHGTAAFPIACYCENISRNPVPWHWHEDLEAIVVTEGTLLLGCGREQHTVRAGEGFFINAGTLHGCWDGGASHCRIHSIVFHPGLVGGTADSVFFQKYLSPLMENRSSGSLPLSPRIPWQEAVIGHIRSAWEAVNQEPPGYEFEVRHHLSRIILLLQGNLPSGGRAVGQKQQRDTQRIKGMLQFIHGHYPERITVTEIAQSVSVSESECLRCFRNTLQLTPNQYLRQYRIRQAANLLDATSEKISVIAHACGFEDLSFFAKTFRELKGMSPSDYRNRCKEGMPGTGEDR